jgi:diguanylate cyclase (GGDEF)-like protein
MAYVTRRLLIGKTQYQLKILPRYYMAAFRHLQDLLADMIRRETKDKPDIAALRIAALQKITILDTHYILDAYTTMMSAEVDAAKLEVREHVEDLERRAKELAEQSRHDDLTGLLNRRAFYEESRRAITMGQRSRTPISIIYIDLDGFKAVNDLRGHLAGDDVLRRVSAAILRTVRETDIACRYGGDEFVLLLPMTPADQAVVVCERLYANYSPVGFGDIDFSFGLAQVGPSLYSTVDEAVKLADELMYKAKSDRGKGSGVRVEVKRFGD